MNIKIITRHTPNNYGSLLQSIATLKVIESLGHECEIIDYWRKDEIGLQGVITQLKGKPQWNNNLWKKLAYICIRYPEEIITSKRFKKMHYKYLKLTNRYYKIEDLSELNADIFITGSDQVWGPMQNGHYDEAYFLSFVKKNKKRVAYASSFGRTEFSENIIRKYKSLLKGYDNISVREKSAVEILFNWGFKCVDQVLDPTLLLNAEDWSKFIKNEVTGRYVLVYEIHHNPWLDKYAKAFAKYVSLPLVRVTSSLHQFNRGGRLVYCPDIGVFLSYIKKATYMITDSFHGTAFAINFNTQFLEILPNNKTGTRNQSILELLGLQKRIVTDFNDYSLAYEFIDYQYVNKKIIEERERSKNRLKNMIKG